MSIRHLFVCGISAVLSFGLISCGKKSSSTTARTFHLPPLELHTSGKTLVITGLETNATRVDIQDAFVFKGDSPARTLQFQTRCQRDQKIWKARMSMTYTQNIPLSAVLPEDLLRPLTLSNKTATHCRFRIIGRTPDGSKNILDLPDLQIVDAQKEYGIKAQSMSAAPIDQQTVTEDTLDRFLFTAPKRNQWTATLLCEDFSISKSTDGQDNVVFNNRDLLKIGSKVQTRVHQPCRVVFSHNNYKKFLSKNFTLTMTRTMMTFQITHYSGNLQNQYDAMGRKIVRNALIQAPIPVFDLAVTNQTGSSKKFRIPKSDFQSIKVHIKDQYARDDIHIKCIDRAALGSVAANFDGADGSIQETKDAFIILLKPGQTARLHLSVLLGDRIRSLSEIDVNSSKNWIVDVLSLNPKNADAVIDRVEFPTATVFQVSQCVGRN